MPHDEPGGRLVQFPLSPSYETIYRAPDGRLCMLVFSGETGSFEAVRADGKVQVGYLDNDTPARFDDTELMWLDLASLRPHNRID